MTTDSSSIVRRTSCYEIRNCSKSLLRPVSHSFRPAYGSQGKYLNPIKTKKKSLTFAHVTSFGCLQATTDSSTTIMTGQELRQQCEYHLLASWPHGRAIFCNNFFHPYLGISLRMNAFNVEKLTSHSYLNDFHSNCSSFNPLYSTNNRLTFRPRFPSSVCFPNQYNEPTSRHLHSPRGPSKR